MMKLEKNVGRIDQVLRVGIGALLIYISLIDTGIIADSFASGVVAFIGSVNLLVGLIGVCPFYSLVGINTCKLS